MTNYDYDTYYDEINENKKRIILKKFANLSDEEIIEIHDFVISSLADRRYRLDDAAKFRNAQRVAAIMRKN